MKKIPTYYNWIEASLLHFVISIILTIVFYCLFPITMFLGEYFYPILIFLISLIGMSLNRVHESIVSLIQSIVASIIIWQLIIFIIGHDIIEPLLATTFEDLSWSVFFDYIALTFILPIYILGLTATISPITQWITNIGFTLIGFKPDHEKSFHFLSRKLSERNNRKYHNEYIEYD